MTLKAAAAGLHQGGGKAVVLWDEPGDDRDDAFLRVLGQAIDELGGRYIAAEDVGATPADMNGIARETRWVTGGDGPGGSGDPSPFTAVGVVAAMRAALRELGEEPSFEGRRVVVQGAGHVGAHLTQLLVEGGAAVTVADVRPDRVEALKRAHDVDATAVNAALEVECDILAPCALGAVLTHDLVPRLRCRAVVGAANNQLAAPDVDDALAARGVLYAPDFVANAGGIINLAEEFVGYDARRALTRTERIGDTMTEVFATARDLRMPPGRAAETMAERRLAREGAGRRWRPGDPTAWTGGEPLRTLRPTATYEHVRGRSETS
jgi:leucine dehydrogenase